MSDARHKDLAARLLVAFLGLSQLSWSIDKICAIRSFQHTQEVEHNFGVVRLKAFTSALSRWSQEIHVLSPFSQASIPGYQRDHVANSGYAFSPQQSVDRLDLHYLPYFDASSGVLPFMSN